MATSEKKITKICPQCGRVLEEEWNSCPFCGRILTGLPVIINPNQSTIKKKSIVGLASLILAVISLIVFGIFLGLAAMILGAYSYYNEKNKLGLWGLIIGLIGFSAAVIILWGGFYPQF